MQWALVFSWPCLVQFAIHRVLSAIALISCANGLDLLDDGRVVGMCARKNVTTVLSFVFALAITFIAV